MNKNQNLGSYKNHPIFDNGQYLAIYYPEHHLADKKGIVLVHRCIAEDLLGRELNPKEVVHHKNQDKKDNRLSNLMVFVNARAHAAFHQGVPVVLTKNGAWDIDYKKIKEQGLKIRGQTRHCIICGKTMPYGEKYCSKCNIAVKKMESKCPSKQTLKDLLETFNYSQIAKKYNVTSNTVKNWAQKYKLYEPCFHDLPDKSEFINDLATLTYKEIENKYKISNWTLNNWIKKFDIKKYQITIFICIESGSVFNSLEEIHKSLFPTLSYETVRTGITKSVLSEQKIMFQGFHWARIVNTFVLQ